MQRTIKVLRIALPILILAFVAVLAMSWNRNAGPNSKKPTEPVTSTQRPSDVPQLEATAFEDTQTIGGRVVSRIRAARVVSFASGWTTLENVQLTLFRPNNLTYDLIAPAAQYNSETKEADAKGGVKVTSSDGVEVMTAEIRYDGTRLMNEIPVQFKVDRWTGNAGALDMDVQSETMRLHKDVTAVMTVLQPGEPATTLKGAETIFHRRENIVTFNQKVDMSRGADNLRADTVTGRFSQDRKTLVGFEGNGNAVITMASNPNPGEDLGGRKQIFCHGFFTEVGSQGEISAINTTSTDKPSHAILDGPPRREIFARTFRIGLLNRAVHEIKADWQVVMKEVGPEVREIKSEHVVVAFDPVAHRATTALLEGDFRYADPKTTATAFRAHYDIVGDRVVLTTDAGWQATVVTEGNTVKAKQIEFSPRAQSAKATGEVIAELVSKGNGPSADTTTLFPSNKSVFVNADSLTMRQVNRVALFTGNVRAWQETNTMLASELQVQGDGSIITAKGGVKTVLYNQPSSPGQRVTPVTANSDSLVAKRADRRIDYLGNVTIQDETRSLTAGQAAFFFDANRKIDRIETETNVVVSERPTSRSGSGSKATYHMNRRMIYVTGAPATLTDPQGTVSGQQIVFDLARNKVQVLNDTGKAVGTYKNPG
jgi:LPS export ABC transporter protein LptC/lipopolysaccharide transport protein LptA